jgi:hypothetical protein
MGIMEQDLHPEARNPALSHVQRWRIVMKTVEKDLVLKLSKLIIDHASHFVPSSILLLDVGFL